MLTIQHLRKSFVRVRHGAVLMMVMLGGAWVPTFIFPAWLQQFTLIVPVR